MHQDNRFKSRPGDLVYRCISFVGGKMMKNKAIMSVILSVLLISLSSCSETAVQEIQSETSKTERQTGTITEV